MQYNQDSYIFCNTILHQNFLYPYKHMFYLLYLTLHSLYILHMFHYYLRNYKFHIMDHCKILSIELYNQSISPIHHSLQNLQTHHTNNSIKMISQVTPMSNYSTILIISQLKLIMSLAYNIKIFKYHNYLLQILY